MNSNPWAAVKRLIDKALAGYCPYSIDDVYVTFSSTKPTARWPGTSWERITDCFLRAADDSHPAGTTGGAWTHTQTYDEVGYASWMMGFGINQQSGSPIRTFPKWAWYFETGVMKQLPEEKTMLAAIPSNLRGSDPKAMNIENKYTAVNMWRRTA